MKHLSILHILALALVISLVLAVCIFGGSNLPAPTEPTEESSTAGSSASTQETAASSHSAATDSTASAAPSQTQSTAPSVTDTTQATTTAPTTAPTTVPTTAPATMPSTQAPTTPTTVPDTQPSQDATVAPTTQPTVPTTEPATEPSVPTTAPTTEPSIPTTAPTTEPSIPTTAPTTEPSIPTTAPTTEPSIPTTAPTTEPSIPTTEPTVEPTTEPTTSETEPTAPALTHDMLGLQQLQSKENSASLVAAYEKLAAGIEAAEAVISLRDEENPLDVEDLDLVYACYRNDYPQHFWLGNSYRYSSSGTHVLSLTPDYVISGDKLATARTMFDLRVDAFLSLLTEGMTDYEKELKLHDLLVRNCSYDTAAPNAHTAYGALVDGQAVCEGYARAFQYLLHRVGINCMLVNGTAGGGAHTWNAVELDGQWYYTDVTWDDPVPAQGQSETLCHGYFNLTQEMMNADHVPHTQLLPPPEATATTYHYHVVNGTMAESFDLEQVSGLLTASDTFAVYVTGDINTYIQAISDNVWALLQAAGKSDWSSVGWSYSLNGRELTIVFTQGT